VSRPGASCSHAQQQPSGPLCERGKRSAQLSLRSPACKGKEHIASYTKKSGFGLKHSSWSRVHGTFFLFFMDPDPGKMNFNDEFYQAKVL
jgi:hypothetical protein